VKKLSCCQVHVAHEGRTLFVQAMPDSRRCDASFEHVSNVHKRSALIRVPAPQLFEMLGEPNAGNQSIGIKSGLHSVSRSWTLVPDCLQLYHTPQAIWCCLTTVMTVVQICLLYKWHTYGKHENLWISDVTWTWQRWYNRLKEPLDHEHLRSTMHLLCKFYLLVITHLKYSALLC
jgi:hypothetical protein